MDSMLPQVPEPPRARAAPVTVNRHGHALVDEYAWLRSGDWQKVTRDPSALEPEIRQHLLAENAYAERILGPLAPLRLTLVAEMRDRIKPDDASVPAKDGPYFYYHRFRPQGQHPCYCRRAGGEDGPEEVLLDGDLAAAGSGYFRIAAAEHSPDHRYLAAAIDRTGSEDFSILVTDLSSGVRLADEVRGAKGEIAWANDSRSFFYTVLDEHHRPSKVYRHALGADIGSDGLVYAETDPAFYLSLDKSEDRRFILITCHGHALTTEVLVVDADQPTAPARSVAGRTPGLEYSVSSRDDRFYLLTNEGGAVDFKIVTTRIGTANGPATWTPLVPHRPGRHIRSMLLFRGHLVRLEREDALPRLVIAELSTGAEHAIDFAEEAYELGLSSGYEFDTTNLRFTYGSPTTPQQVFDYDLATRVRRLRKQQEVPSGHNAADYVCRRMIATAADGARVPVTILHHVRTAIDGTAPLLLYGYGAYGFALPAFFAGNRLSLIDRGFVYAIAHVRGGSERGTGWYLDGKLARKTNSFTDFVAAAQALVAAGYSAAGNIAIHGASAGGLLVGAVANLRPDLFRAVVAEVPFVDVLNTMSDATLPLTPPEWSEWGNPAADPDDFARIRAYSPYDNIAARAYPHVLATAGLADPRVTYWEPAKWVARLRARTTGERLILLKTNMEAGHGGKAGRFDKLDEVALVYAFLLFVFGMTERAPYGR